MPEKLDIASYVQTIESCLSKLYSDELDLSKYKFPKETLDAYSMVGRGMKEEDQNMINNAFFAMYQLTDARIPETGIKNYGEGTKERQLFDLIHNTIGEMYNRMGVDIDSELQKIAQELQGQVA